MARSLDVAAVGEPARCEVATDVTCALQDEAMEPIGGVGVSLADGVVDEQWDTHGPCLLTGHVERRVLVCPDRCAHPIEYEVASFTRLGGGPAGNAFLEMWRESVLHVL